MTVRIKKQLGSPAVQDLIERARKRARELPIDTLLDPWPDSRRTLGAARIQLQLRGRTHGMVACQVFGVYTRLNDADVHLNSNGEV